MSKTSKPLTSKSKKAALPTAKELDLDKALAALQQETPEDGSSSTAETETSEAEGGDSTLEEEEVQSINPAGRKHVPNHGFIPLTFKAEELRNKSQLAAAVRAETEKRAREVPDRIADARRIDAKRRKVDIEAKAKLIVDQMFEEEVAREVARLRGDSAGGCPTMVEGRPASASAAAAQQDPTGQKRFNDLMGGVKKSLEGIKDRRHHKWQSTAWLLALVTLARAIMGQCFMCVCV
jgi:hypothetical protein